MIHYLDYSHVGTELLFLCKVEIAILIEAVCHMIGAHLSLRIF